MSDLLVVESKYAQWNKIHEKLIAEFSEHDAQGQALEKVLKDLDPRLIVRFIESVPPDMPRHGIKENRWHIIRTAEHENEYEPYLPIVGPNLEYRAPEMKVAEDMKKADLWKEGALDRLFKEREKQERAAEAAEKLKMEQLQDTFLEEFRAAKRSRNETELEKRAAPERAGE